MRNLLKNTYFDHNVQSEQDLYEDIVIESISMYGQDIYYLPRDVVELDTILNEDVESKFNDSHLLVAYVEDTEGFGGEGDLLSKFGLEIRDEASFIISRKAWNYYVGSTQRQARPNEGDLIYLPLSKSMFEISFVEHEKPFYQLSNLPVFRLQCRLFEYNDEEFNTGINDIDLIEQYSFTLNLILDNVIGSFQRKERIEQTLLSGEIISAEVLDFNENGILVTNLETSNNEYAEFEGGRDIRGLTSEAVGRLVSKPTQFENDGNAQNNEFSQFVDNDIINFNENNPFGD